MTDYGVTLGVPNTGMVEGTGDRKHANQEQPRKKKKKQKDAKPRLFAGQDEVTLSEAQQTQSTRRRPAKEVVVDDGKGTFVDVVA